ncbi:MAG TPA: putative toxin-antitoxin system toxin component, PIN family [Edaphobacter sp.]|jgi:hypothetical protein|nr:putative toxin-antitoxin system toxin component, PIN family [Edaphobacter sp.]
MLVVLDSNVLLSALISPYGAPHRIYKAWREPSFKLATCREQIEELRRASRYPKFREILQPHQVGLMLNNLRDGEVFDRVPAKHKAKDSHDSYLLDLAEFASANYLVTGDKRAGMLELKRVGTARIVTAMGFVKTLQK